MRKEREKGVSIILPTYNREATLPRAIYSIMQQSYQNWEVLVIDDASTDETEDLVASIMQEDERIHYFRLKENRGAGYARNYGITHARFDLIAFQDSDDEWLPDKLEKQVAALSDTDGVCYCNYNYYHFNGKLLGECPDTSIDEVLKHGYMLPQLLAKNMIGTPAMLVRRSCLEDVGGFNTTLSCLEDYELVLRLAAKYNIAHVNEVLLNAFATLGSISMDNVDGYFQTRIHVFRTYQDVLNDYGIRDHVMQAILEKAERSGRREEIQKMLE